MGKQNNGKDAKIKMLITKRLKVAATKAFLDNAKLSEMSREDRTEAARQYDKIADEMVGVRADLARLYNLERAKFLRGDVQRIAKSAPNFAAEIGFFNAAGE